MAEPLGHWRRTHTCGELRLEDVGKQVTLMGWVAKRRDHGGVIFVDLRDRSGITQAVFRPDVNPGVHSKAEAIRGEYVLAVQGKVEPRPEGMANPKLPTGAIDVECAELRILSEAETPPFPIESDVEVNEELRLRYRYLDLRRPHMQEVLALRHRISQATRSYLSGNQFLEIETPFLMKSTPEGARDYLVPSRVNPGQFYALPQSPQTYKQLLMVAGLERYFQIVRCFRDEDLRGDRQPEFTQIDIEMSFVEENDVMGLAEGLAFHLFKEILGIEIAGPIQRLTYREAMDRYGVDRPDTRYGMEIVDLREAAMMSEFQVFRGVLESEGQVRGINAKGCAGYSRKQIDDLTAFSARLGAKGLAWIKVTEGGLESSIVKFFPEAAQAQLRTSLEAEPGDLLLFVADRPDTVAQVLGNLRQELARQLNLLGSSDYSFRWVTHFPLVEWDTEGKRFAAVHHPFTSPAEEDLDQLESDPSSACARAYDLVLNGNEIAGGSIRIHRRDVQDRVFRLLVISPRKPKRSSGSSRPPSPTARPPTEGSHSATIDWLP